MKGFVAFPNEFAQSYRQEGYWKDITLAEQYKKLCIKYADRIAVCTAQKELSYQELDRSANQLALNLLDCGLKAGEIVLLQLGNVLEFVQVYLALQKIGVRPILALHTHRYRELQQFVSLSGAVATITMDKSKDCDFIDIINRVQQSTNSIRLKIVLGKATADFVSLNDLLERKSNRSVSELENIQKQIDPSQPALFLLSGGTTGIPKLIPRTHNDYICNSELASSVTDVREDSVLLDVLPIAHNLPLACPGLQGFMFKGAKVVLHDSTRAEEIFPLIERFGVTHIHVVPALLIMWMNDPKITHYNLDSVKIIQSGGQCLQPETRILTEKILKNCTVQENFGMAEGLLMFVHLDDPLEIRRETVGRPICAADEVMLLDEYDQPVPDNVPGELCCRGPYTLRGYFNAEEHNARSFTPDGFYRSGDMMRRLPSGNYVVEGRKKDLINRGGEKISAEEIENLILSYPKVQNVACVAMPDAILGEKMCAFVILKEDQNLTLTELVEYLKSEEIARFKLPERLEIVKNFPLSTFGKVSKKDLVEMIKERLLNEGAA
ncbi:(2,3-dihydroxybenzoyl)adenylate synthase [Acinetobacter pittii]|uniref:(2,3-dihydroxybenzoyl)adenylate synthase n=1 Tax=Acinetobacter pittii TaxID=48296 RepID=UPI0024DEA4AE|nr:AMP-binding protein [Acinetobacter pittii]